MIDYNRSKDIHTQHTIHHHMTGQQARKDAQNMKNWRTAKALYHITEISRSKKEEYHMIMTGEEVGAWCKMKNELYGFVPGLGGDKSYQCIAVLMNYSN